MSRTKRPGFATSQTQYDRGSHTRMNSDLNLSGKHVPMSALQSIRLKSYHHLKRASRGQKASIDGTLALKVMRTHTSNIPNARTAKDADELTCGAPIVRYGYHIGQRAIIVFNDLVEDINEVVGCRASAEANHSSRGD